MTEQTRAGPAIDVYEWSEEFGIDPDTIPVEQRVPQVHIPHRPFRLDTVELQPDWLMAIQGGRSDRPGSPLLSSSGLVVGVHPPSHHIAVLALQVENSTGIPSFRPFRGLPLAYSINRFDGAALVMDASANGAMAIGNNGIAITRWDCEDLKSLRLELLNLYLEWVDGGRLIWQTWKGGEDR